MRQKLSKHHQLVGELVSEGVSQRASDRNHFRIAGSGNRVSTLGRALRLNRDVLVGAIDEVRRPSGAGIEVGLPVLNGSLDLTHVGDAGTTLRVVAVLDEVRDGDGGEDADDRDHDHDFDERKALGLFHFVCSLLGVNVNFAIFGFSGRCRQWLRRWQNI